MLFNSIDFAIFLPIVFAIYWYLVNGSLRLQNAFLVVASYVFYGWWDWRFLALLIFSTLIDYSIGRRLAEEADKTKRKALLWSSIVLNIGVLVFFKYADFFLENFITAFSFFGAQVNARALHIVLPIGISFYTFQTLAYTIDVYRKKIRPTTDLWAYAAFVSFFPQLVAGPIERATHLLPQFLHPRKFDDQKAVDGLRQILWGLFKKIVIADNCARFADLIFDQPEAYPGSVLVLGAFFFAVQIYGDFSGYSDIAIGTARLFGFDLLKNFAFPYFSRDIAEFWRRWHISLTSWFRDYLYIPLGGSRGSIRSTVRNIFIVFMISGLWHGARWTFVIWGALHALYYLPLLLTRTNRKNLDTIAPGRAFPRFREFVSMLSTAILTTFAWIFFRSETLNQALLYISGIFSASLFTFPDLSHFDRWAITLLLLTIFFAIEWSGRERAYAIAGLGLGWDRVYRWALYFTLIACLFIFSGQDKPFIYFQF